MATANQIWKQSQIGLTAEQRQAAPAAQATLAQYEALAANAERERLAQQQRELARQAEVKAGYDQQLAYSQQAGNQAYQTLQANYDPILADALATRQRNMERVDKYGASMRDDLNVRNQQALAAASQSAIKRGLGNTTIYDSLQRGQNFDNTRQHLALEDQLLQNRIATDSNLSGAYQGVMMNRAGALNQQANQNIGNANQLAGAKLGYIGNISEDMNAFNSVANLYSQGYQLANQNNQAALDRQNQLLMQQRSQSYSQPVQTYGAAPLSGFQMAGQTTNQIQPIQRGSFVGSRYT